MTRRNDLADLRAEVRGEIRDLRDHHRALLNDLYMRVEALTPQGVQDVTEGSNEPAPEFRLRDLIAEICQPDDPSALDLLTEIRDLLLEVRDGLQQRALRRHHALDHREQPLDGLGQDHQRVVGAGWGARLDAIDQQLDVLDQRIDVLGHEREGKADAGSVSADSAALSTEDVAEYDAARGVR